jgi:hypothetical protein
MVVGYRSYVDRGTELYTYRVLTLRLAIIVDL